MTGIVSEHDLLAAIDARHHLDAAAAKDIMTSHPYSVRAETTLGTLVRVLRASDLVRIPVVDAKDKLIGITPDAMSCKLIRLMGQTKTERNL